MAMLAILAACHKYFACGNKVLFCSVLQRNSCVILSQKMRVLSSANMWWFTVVSLLFRHQDRLRQAQRKEGGRGEAAEIGGGNTGPAGERRNQR